MTPDQRTVVILGSTGSIGTQAIEVIDAYPEAFDVIGLAAGPARLDLLAAQAVHCAVEYVAIATPVGTEGAARAAFSEAWAAARTRAVKSVPEPTMLIGPSAPTELAAIPVDVVLNGITGSVGLEPTLAALSVGSRVALANKESLVVGADLVRAHRQRPDQITPVDSEHSAIAQALRSGQPEEVRRLVLTASGGPFRGRARSDLADVTYAEALAHPTWSMGPVVTVNSATLMNKGLELIEAHVLFDLPMSRIDVVVHPQSIVHSMVEFVDGSTIAQASPPDMRLPIALGLAWPHRLDAVVPACDWTRAQEWTFEPLDAETFPAVDLARHVGERGGILPAAFNAANEVCVAAFSRGHIGFSQIVDIVAKVVERLEDSDRSHSGHALGTLTLEEVLHAEDEGRALAARYAKEW